MPRRLRAKPTVAVVRCRGFVKPHNGGVEDAPLLTMIPDWALEDFNIELSDLKEGSVFKVFFMPPGRREDGKMEYGIVALQKAPEVTILPKSKNNKVNTPKKN